MPLATPPIDPTILQGLERCFCDPTLHARVEIRANVKVSLLSQESTMLLIIVMLFLPASLKISSVYLQTRLDIFKDRSVGYRIELI